MTTANQKLPKGATSDMCYGEIAGLRAREASLEFRNTPQTLANIKAIPAKVEQITKLIDAVKKENILMKTEKQVRSETPAQTEATVHLAKINAQIEAEEAAEKAAKEAQKGHAK